MSDDLMLNIFVLAVIGLVLSALIAATLVLSGVGVDQHTGQHCVQKTWAHHAKTSDRWECTKWAKN